MQFILGIIFIAIAITIHFIRKSYLSKIQYEFETSNEFINPDSDDNSPALMRINGCGMNLAGQFRKANIEGYETYITYHTFHLFFIPIIAGTAYRVIDAQGGGWHILGAEEGSALERFLVFLNGSKWVFLFVGIISVIIFLLNYQ